MIGRSSLPVVEEPVRTHTLRLAGRLPRGKAAGQFDGANRISGRNGFYYLDVQLPPRQKQIVRLLAEGLSQVEIARRLGVSQSVVRQQVTAAVDKLKLWNTASLVTWARLYPEKLA